MATVTDRFSSVLTKLGAGSKSLTIMLEMLRQRLDAETTFTDALQRIIGTTPKLISGLGSTESIRTYGFDALFCDMKNEYVQRIEFLNSLRKDVYDPCVRMQQIYEASNKSFISDMNRKTKLHKKHQDEYTKVKEQYDKIMGKKHSASKAKKQPAITRKYTQKQLIWKRQQNSFDVELSSFFDVEMLMEYQRMNTLKDGLTKWAAFITNLSANRGYDVQNLARSVEHIDIEQELHCFMERFHPKQLKPNSPCTAYASSLYSDFKRQSVPNDTSIRPSKT
eukprot:181214_1